MPSLTFVSSPWRRYDYFRIAAISGLAHFTLVQPTTSACAAAVFTFCGNISANVTEVSLAVRRALSWAVASSDERRALVAQAAHWTERWHPDRPTVCEYRHMLPFPSCTRRPHCCM